MSPEIINKSTADLDWCLKLEKHWLGEEDLAGLETEGAYLGLEKFGLFRVFVSEFVDDLVDVDLVGFVHFSIFNLFKLILLRMLS